MYCKEHGVTVEFCDRCFCEGKKNSVSIIFAGKMKLELQLALLGSLFLNLNKRRQTSTLDLTSTSSIYL